MTKASLYVKGTQFLRGSLFALFSGSMLFHLYKLCKVNAPGEMTLTTMAAPLFFISVTTLLTLLFKDLELKRWKKMLFYMLMLFLIPNALVTVFKMIFGPMFGM